MQTDLTLHLEKVLAQLRAERDLLDHAIANLEGLSVQRKRPRGRPPGRLSIEHSGSHVRAARSAGDL